MSADSTRYKDTSKNDDDPIIQQAVLSLVRALGTPDPSKAPEPDEAENREILAHLLRAIQSTEIAARLGVTARTDNETPPLLASAESAEVELLRAIQGTEVAARLGVSAPADTEKPDAPDAPAPAQPAKTELLRAIQGTEVAARLGVAAPADTEKPQVPDASAEPAETPPVTFTSDTPVSAPPVAPSTQPIPPPPEPVSPSAPAEPQKAARPLRIFEAPSDQAPPEAEAAAQPAPTAAPRRRPTSAREATLKAAIFAKLSEEVRRIASTAGRTEEFIDRAEMQLENWFLHWFGPPDPRQSPRLAKPPLVAYHWIVDLPQAIQIADISAGGLRLITDEPWPPGNIISMTLQRTDREKGSPDSWVAVDFIALRQYNDGVAGAFIPSVPGLSDAVAGRAKNCADKKTLERFVKQLMPPEQKKPFHTQLS